MAAIAMLGRASADQPAAVAPVVSVRSASGAVTIEGGSGTDVRVTAGSASLSHFSVGDTGEARLRLPRVERFVKTAAGMRLVFLAPHHLPIPESLLNADGIGIVNTGGDLKIAVPQRLGALFIRAAAGDVVIKGVSTPYIVDADDASVRLRDVIGHGLIRTVTGNVDVSGVAGFVRVESGAGTINAEPAAAERAHIFTEWGDINWRFGRLGRGEYRFRTRGGAIRLLLRSDAGALVDAQSDLGGVVNRFAPGAVDVRFASAHQLSLGLGGGGPEVSAYSKRGTIVVGPAPH